MTCSNPVTALTGDVDVVEALTCCEEAGPDDPPVPDDFVAVIVHQTIPYEMTRPFVPHSQVGISTTEKTAGFPQNPGVFNEPTVLTPTIDGKGVFGVLLANE